MTVPFTESEIICDYIIENICGGLVLKDEEEASYTSIKFYIAVDDDITSKLTDLRKFLISLNPDYDIVNIDHKKIANLDWEEAYRKSVTPVEIGSSIVIKPPWCRDKFPDKIEIVIEPKMAFGTGRHETTRGTLAALAEIEMTGRKVLDLGCGSGILGIFAARKGAIEVRGYDLDPLAVENSRENYFLNHVENICRADLGSIDNIPDEQVFDVVVANIIKAVIIPIIGSLKLHTCRGGHIILSGLLEHDARDLERALEAIRLADFDKRNDNGWLTYTIRVT